MSRHKHGSRIGSFLKGAVVGGITLGVTALLWAPKKGLQLRHDLMNGAKKIKKKAKGTKRAAKKAVRRIRKH